MGQSLTSRERIQRMFEDKDSDRVPIVDLPWDSTMARWYREGLPVGADWAEVLAVDFIRHNLPDNSRHTPLSKSSRPPSTASIPRQGGLLARTTLPTAARVEDPEWVLDMVNPMLDRSTALLEMVEEAGYKFDSIMWYIAMGYQGHQSMSACSSSLPDPDQV
jgi:hypothetical protein